MTARDNYERSKHKNDPAEKADRNARRNRRDALANKTTQSAQDMVGDLGRQTQGEFIAVSPTSTSVEPDDPGFTGSFMSAIGYVFSGLTYFFGSVASGVLQWGASSDGGIYAALGAVLINALGIVITGLLTALKFTATLGSNTRELSMSLQPNGSGDTPIGGMYYQDPTVGTNLVTTNPGLEAGDTSGFTLTGSVFTNSTDYASSGTHSLKRVDGSGTAKTTRYAITAGVNYTAQFRLKVLTYDPHVSIHYYLRFYDAVSGGSQVGGSQEITASAAALLNGFSLYTGSTTAPVGATYAAIEIDTTSLTGFTFYFDDFSLAVSSLSRSLTFGPDLSYRISGIKRDFVFAPKVFLPNILAISAAQLQITNNYTIPANTLTGNGVLRIINRGVVVNHTGSNQSFTISITTLGGGIGASPYLTLATATIECGYEYEAFISINPNNSAQIDVHEVLTVEAGAGNADNVFSRHTISTLDMTANQTLRLFADFNSVTSGLLSCLSEFFSIELLPGTDATAETYTWRSQLTAVGNDTDMRSNTPTTNFSATGNRFVGESNAAADIRRTLIKFTLPTLPATAVVTSAKLILFLQNDLSSNARDFKVYRVRRDWVASQATWNIWKTANNWTTAGCGDTTNDYDSTVWATVSMTATETLDTAKTFSLDLTEFNKMLNGTYSNFGWLIKADTENNDAYGFYPSWEATNTSERPILEITYTIPPTGNE